MNIWIYVSEALLGADDHHAAVNTIVQVSRQRNLELDVTGALLFTGSRFAQIIEGPAHAIVTLREAITADPRHGTVTPIRFGPVTQRLFSDWSLAYAGTTQFMSRLLDEVKLGQLAQPQSVENSIFCLFEEFAATRPLLPPAGKQH